jgi:hypothetical protein
LCSRAPALMKRQRDANKCTALNQSALARRRQAAASCRATCAETTKPGYVSDAQSAGAGACSQQIVWRVAPVALQSSQATNQMHGAELYLAASFFLSVAERSCVVPTHATLMCANRVWRGLASAHGLAWSKRAIRAFNCACV